jgi:hypothetical protein
MSRALTKNRVICHKKIEKFIFPNSTMEKTFNFYNIYNKMVEDVVLYYRLSGDHI